MTTVRLPKGPIVRPLSVWILVVLLAIAVGFAVAFETGDSSSRDQAAVSSGSNASSGLEPAGSGLRWSASVVPGGIADTAHLILIADQDTATPSIDIVDAATGATVAHFDTGYLPNGALLDSSHRLLIIDHLMPSVAPAGYVPNVNGVYPRLLVFELVPEVRLASQSSISGYAVSMYMPGFAVSRDQQYLYYPIPTVGNDVGICNSGLVGDPCNRDLMSVGAVNLVTLESSSASQELGPGCGAVWLTPSGQSSALATCASSGQIVQIDASQPGATTNVVSRTSGAPLDTDPGRTRTSAIGQGGFALPDGGAGTLFGDGSFVYSDAAGARHQLRVTPDGRRVSSAVPPITMPDGTTLIIPLANSAADGEADAVQVFDLARLQVLRTFPFEGIYSIHSISEQDLVVIGEAGELSILNVKTGASHRLGASTFPGRVLQR
jgi:hypothetical protein